MSNKKGEANGSDASSVAGNKAGPNQKTIRPDMVETARHFMLLPKVRQTSFMQQREFLLGKGLSEEEIEEAKKILSQHSRMGAESSFIVDSESSVSLTTMPSLLPPGRWTQLAKITLIFTGFTYASWHFLKSVVLPHFGYPNSTDEQLNELQSKMSELERSMAYVSNAAAKTLRTVIEQQKTLGAIILKHDATPKLEAMSEELKNISALLQSQNQSARERSPPRKRPSNPGKVVCPVISNPQPTDGTKVECFGDEAIEDRIEDQSQSKKAEEKLRSSDLSEANAAQQNDYEASVRRCIGSDEENILVTI